MIIFRDKDEKWLYLICLLSVYNVILTWLIMPLMLDKDGFILNTFFTIYIIFWASACVIALIIFLMNRRSFVISPRDYCRFLLQPWKIITFLIAASTMIVIAPYTGDYTWDYFDAGFMSVFTFIFAPWTAGVLYKAFRRQVKVSQVYIAACAWMFSASWSYDLYMLLKIGHYPAT